MHTNNTQVLFDVEPFRSSLLSTLRKIQQENRFISREQIHFLAQAYNISEVEVEGVIGFYHFLHRQPTAKHIIYLNNSTTSEIKGFSRIKEAIERETGASQGQVSRDGMFAFFETPCIGLCDQEPAALIDMHPFTHLNAAKIKYIISHLRAGTPTSEICDQPEDNIQYIPETGSVFFSNFLPGSALKNVVTKKPVEIIQDLNLSMLAGRGGAFFPTWLKWQSAVNQQANPKFVICNADEGEPGTFKDRVLLTNQAASVIEGMIIAGYTIGAAYGIIYLRAEYLWLSGQLQEIIDEYYHLGLLGKNAGGIEAFHFDLRMEIGAGAYVCGEETALLESLEGKRGEPRTRWFFPTERGYLQKPTLINNVETFAAVARVFEKGVVHYSSKGITGSPGTKLISVSGDCEKPGIYEIEWGVTVAELLELCDAKDAKMIQVSGPSGELISVKEKFRRISMLDLMSRKDIRCGGAFTVYNSDRDILKLLRNYAEFFKKESCGICTPCRAGNVLLERKLEKIANGMAQEKDLEELKHWSSVMKASSRCGLGKTAPNPVLFALEKFPSYFQEKLYDGKETEHGIMPFDLDQALSDYEIYKNA